MKMTMSFSCEMHHQDLTIKGIVINPQATQFVLGLPGEVSENLNMIYVECESGIDEQHFCHTNNWYVSSTRNK